MMHRHRGEWWRPHVEDVSPLPSARLGTLTPAASESPLPFWALMAFTFILFIAPQEFIPALAPFRIAMLTGGFAVVAYLVVTFMQRRTIPFSREMRIAACLVAWALVTVPMSYWPGGSLGFLLGGFLRSVVIFWLLGNLVTTAARLRRVAWALTLMTVPLAMTALHNFVSGNFLQGSNRIIGYDAPMTGNPNGLALVLSLVLPLSVGLLVLARRTVTRLLLFSVIALNVMAVVVTFSRAGFLTLGLVIVTYLYKLLRRPEWPWAIATCVLLLVGTPLLPPDYLNRLATMTDIESDPTGSAQSRWSDTLAAMRLVAGKPIIGAGIGQNVIALNEERGATWAHIHNVYLMYAVDLGIPGLLLFLLLLVRSIQNTWLVYRRSAGVPALREFFFLAEALQTSLVIFAVGAFFHTVAYEFHFYYFAGLAVALKIAFHAEADPLDKLRSAGSEWNHSRPRDAVPHREPAGGIP